MEKYYRHFKGNLYRLIGIAKDSETLEDLVVYQALYGEHQMWVRPADMFFGTVERDGKVMPRFEEISKEEAFGKKKTNNMKTGLKPWVGERPKVLILGTMAGDTSIQSQSYYDSPLNPFWKLMEAIFPLEEKEEYATRKEFITAKGIALWDCIESGIREGSSDIGFSEKTLKGNDIQGFLDEHPTIHTIVLNGTSTTTKYFERYCPIQKNVNVIALPSTVSMITYQKKLEAWIILKTLV